MKNKTIPFLQPLVWINLVFLLAILGSCSSPIEYKKTKSGLEYHFFEKLDTGKTGKPGYYYLVDLIGQREDDSSMINHIP